MQRTVSKRRVAAAFAALGLAATLAACSGGGNNSSGAGSFTGAPIKVMTVSIWNTTAANNKEPVEVAAAAASALNAKGGIDGHEVVAIGCDDDFSVNGAAACAREAVSDGVSAMIGGWTAMEPTILPILGAANIPWIGPPATATAGMTSKNSFPIVAGTQQYPALADKLYTDGCKTIGVAAVEDPGFVIADHLFNLALAKKGTKIAQVVRVPINSVSFDSIAAELSKDDCVITSSTVPQDLGIIAAARQAGSKTRFYATTGTLTGELLKSSEAALQGLVTYDSFPVDTKPIWDAAKKADPTVDWTNPYNKDTWVSMQILATVLKGAKSVTGASVLNALNSATAVNTGGFTPTLDFAKQYPVAGLNRLFNPTIQFEMVQGDKFVADDAPVDASKAAT